MIVDVILPTVHQLQVAPYTCGAACINMVLSLWAKQQPQPQIWAEIQVNTMETRPANAEWVSGSFSTQRCEDCGGGPVVGHDGNYYGDYRCWFTTPEAAAATLNTRAPNRAGAEYTANCAAAILRIVDSLAAADPMPAMLTIKPALHWVTATGYQTGGPGSSILRNGQPITGLYVRNPELPDPGPDVVRMITIDGLCRPGLGLLMAVECGPHAGTNPVVVKGLGLWAWLVILATTFLRSVARFVVPARLRRSPPSPRPGPPPIG
jgi:hypothetical protein